MGKSRIWDGWLLAVAVAMAAFGVFMAAFNRSAAFDGFNRQINPAFWEHTIDGSAERFQAWAYGVWGATVAGFGVMAAFIARNPYRARKRWARNAILTAVGLWFILDTGLSAWHDVWFNVGFNLVVLIAIAIPLAATWREFRGALPK